MSEGTAYRSPNPSSSKRRSNAGNRGGDRPDSSVAEPSVSPEDLIPRLKAFIDLVLREMALAMSYEIVVAKEPEKAHGDEHDDPNPGQRDGAPRVATRTGAQEDEDGLMVRFSGEDEEILLARNGELLLALEYLAHRWLHLSPALHDAVRFECGDFRATRLEELKLSARVAAQRVRETGQPFPFNPMSSRDRRMIHLELNGAAGIRTISEGNGDRRHLVIYPASKK